MPDKASSVSTNGAICGEVECSVFIGEEVEEVDLKANVAAKVMPQRWAYTWW